MNYSFTKILTILFLSCHLALFFTSIAFGAEAGAVTIRVGGTGSALGCMRAAAAAFSKTQDGIAVKVPPSLGTSGGIRAVNSGVIDIAVASRPPKASEGGDAIRYAWTPQVFVVHRDVEIDGGSITLGEVASIYRGETIDWPGGEPIRLVLRPSNEFNTQFLRRISPEMDRAVKAAQQRKGLQTALTDQDNLDFIEETPGAFGVASLSQIRCEDRDVRLLAADGIAPTPEAVADGSYALSKGFYFVTDGTPSPAAREFIDFVRSRPGRAILRANGHLLEDVSVRR